MKTKHFIIPVLVSFVLVLFSGQDTFAQKRKLWTNMCASCHDGKAAPAADALKEKHPTTEKFSEAVNRKGSQCMNMVRSNPNVIKKIAKEIGIAESKVK